MLQPDILTYGTSALLAGDSIRCRYPLIDQSSAVHATRDIALAVAASLG